MSGLFFAFRMEGQGVLHFLLLLLGTFYFWSWKPFWMLISAPQSFSIWYTFRIFKFSKNSNVSKHSKFSKIQIHFLNSFFNSIFLEKNNFFAKIHFFLKKILNSHEILVLRKALVKPQFYLFYKNNPNLLSLNLLVRCS